MQRSGNLRARRRASKKHRISVEEEVDDLDRGLDRARELAAAVALRSPTAVAAFKAAALACVGQAPERRQEIEARAYEHCLETGEAAIGRENFKTIREGSKVPWGPLKPFDPGA